MRDDVGKAPSSGRVSMFSTHRGRVVRTVFILFGAIAFGLMIFSPPPENNQSASATSVDPYASGQQDRSESEVAPPVANPMSPGPGVKRGSENGSASTPAPASTPGPQTFQKIATASQDAAVAYSTFDYRSDPQEWVSNIRRTTPELSAALNKSAAESWPLLRDRQTATKATLSQGAPTRVAAFDSDKGTAQVVVSVTQTVSNTETRSMAQGKSVGVTLVRQGDPESAPSDGGSADSETWLITDITSN